MTRPFRFAVQSYSAVSAADWREQARTAESLGYSAFHLADHVIGPGPALDPTNHPVQTIAAIPGVMAAAAATERIKVGCRVFCCDYRNPSVFVKELLTLDLLSEGRLEVGLGAGWLHNEYDAIGVPWLAPGERLTRLEETIALLRSSAAEGLLDAQGKYVHAVGFEAVPKPIQQPLPIMIGGGARRVLGIAGREADIVSLNFDNSSGRIGPEGVGSGTAEATHQKIEWIRAGAQDRFDEIELEIAAYFTVVTDQRESTLAGMAKMFGLTPAQLGDHPHSLIGSIDAICEQLIARREAYGISYVTVGRTVMEAFAPVVARLSGI